MLVRVISADAEDAWFIASKEGIVSTCFRGDRPTLLPQENGFLDLFHEDSLYTFQRAAYRLCARLFHED